MKLIFEIFLSSMKVGALTFGGGYAMIPVLQREVSEHRGWCTQEEIVEWYALSQCLPGIIMVNTLVFMGRKKKGVPGAVAAGVGAVVPSLVIIMLIAGLLTAFAEVPAVKNAFAGIRVCVCVLIFNSVVKLWSGAVTDKAGLVIFVLVTAGSLFFSVSPAVFILGAAAAGIVLALLGVAGETKK